jgi:Fe2+ transport system protein B
MLLLFWHAQGVIPPPPSPDMFRGAGTLPPGYSHDAVYQHKVEQHWQQIDTLRRKIRAKELLAAEQQDENTRIHARMAELRSIKARKKIDRESKNEELLALKLEERQIALSLAQAIAEQQQMEETITHLIDAFIDYKRRYVASLVMLLNS